MSQETGPSLSKVTAPVEKATAPLGKATAPLEEATAPLEKATGPVENLSQKPSELTGELEKSTAALSPMHLLQSAVLRTLGLAGKHLGFVAAGVGTLVLASTGGYLLGRRSRPRAS